MNVEDQDCRDATDEKDRIIVALRARLATAEAERDELISKACELLDERERARAEVARLREAFARYARHDDDCGPWAGGCRCGYAAAKAAKKGLG